MQLGREHFCHFNHSANLGTAEKRIVLAKKLITKR